MRQTGEDRYRIRGEKALQKMKEWSMYSDWNFKNKLLLMLAEWHNTLKDYDNAALCYESSIKAAHKHKFIHEEALAYELAGIFFLERGLRPKSYQFFMSSIECYTKWGAHAVAKRVKDSLRDKFDADLIHRCPSYALPESPAPNMALCAAQSKEPSSKKRQMSD